MGYLFIAAACFLAVFFVSPHNWAIAWAEGWLAVIVWTIVYALLVYARDRRDKEVSRWSRNSEQQ